MSALAVDPDPITLAAALEGRLGSAVQDALDGVELAEEEIKAARRRYPEHADRIWHAFGLLQPTHALMSTPFILQGHVRELLDRVAAGQDTRPGTWAEIALVCRDVSLRVPLNTPAAGLYTRAWNRGFADRGLVDPMPSEAHYEALERTAIDDMEREARAKAAEPWRALAGSITCKGQHHGAWVACRYAPGGR